MLVGCIDHSISKNDFMIRVDTGYKERTGKDYIQCWVNDSLVFNGLYVNKTDDQILDYHEDWLGMEITDISYPTIKIHARRPMLRAWCFVWHSPNRPGIIG